MKSNEGKDGIGWGRRGLELAYSIEIEYNKSFIQVIAWGLAMELTKRSKE